MTLLFSALQPQSIYSSIRPRANLIATISYRGILKCCLLEGEKCSNFFFILKGYQEVISCFFFIFFFLSYSQLLQKCNLTDFSTSG